MLEASKFGDPVLGVDIHMVLVPAPPAPAPIPTPLPHPFVGVVFDPLGAAIGAALGLAFGGGGPVLINYMPCGNTGTEVKGVPHFPTPPGVSFAPNDIPSNDGTLIFGSKTVTMAGSSIARLTDLVMTCNFPINLPTSVCMAVPMGAPVLVGGPPSMDWFAAITKAIRTRWFSDMLHKVTGGRFSKVICFLTGHPVDVMTGEVLTDRADFELPGPLPLTFERDYCSRSTYDGPLGPGWSHSLDQSVHEEDWRLVVRLADGRERHHPRLAEGASLWDDVDRYTLERTDWGYALTTVEGLTHSFARVEGAQVTHPLVRVNDRCNNTIGLRYDRGVLAEVTDSGGRLLRFEHRADGRLARVCVRRRTTRDERWMELARYEYDPAGMLAAAFDAEGGPSRYGYRGGVLVKETDRNGHSYHFEYDWEHAEGWCVRTWGDGGIYDRRLTYDKHRHVTLVDDSRGGRTHYFGNAAGLVVKKIDPTGAVWRYEYDRGGRQTALVDPLGGRTEREFDARGNKAVERDALGYETRWTYGDHDLPIEVRDATGRVWRREHDARGLLTCAIDPDGAKRRYSYDERGRLVGAEDPLGRRMYIRRDPRGEPTEESDWEGNVTAYTTDDLGRRVSVRDAVGREVVFTRSDGGRLVSVRRSDGSVSAFDYDGEGRAIRVTDGRGRVTRYRYTAAGRVAGRTDPSGTSVSREYDTEQNLVAVVNARGEAHRMEYDLAGRLVRETTFGGRVHEYRYDKAGRRAEAVHASGRRTRFERGARGELRALHAPDGATVRYGYDGLGRLTEAVNGECAVRFEYDAYGRVVREQSGDDVIESRHDAAGRKVARRTSLGHEVAFDRDANGRLRGLMVDADPRWMRWTRDDLERTTRPSRPWQMHVTLDAVGREVERRLPGEVIARWDRDDCTRTHTHRVSHGDRVLSAQEYRWRERNELAVRVDARRGLTRFDHDERGRLVAEHGPEGSVRYRVADEVGDLYASPLRTDRVYGPGGVLCEAEGERFVHDVAGRLVERVARDGRRWRYAWDALHQLREVSAPSGERVTYGYDALGRRVRKSVGGRTTRYVWDSHELVHELTPGESAVTWVCDPEGFAPAVKIEGARRYGVVTDSVGAPVALTDESGELAWSAQLDLYGVARADVAQTGCPWRWPGQYEDEETGLYYNRFRYYDPRLGRYLSPDPIGLRGGLEPYAYVDDPFAWVDPLGLSKKGPCGLSGDALEDEVEKALREAGVPIEKRAQDVKDATGRVLTDIDIEVPQAIIEVTSKRSGKLEQIEQRVTNALINPTGKPVILYAPNYLGTAGAAVEGAGGLVVRNLSDLVALVR